MPTLDGKKVFLVDFIDENSLEVGYKGLAVTKTPAIQQMFVAMKKQVKLVLSEDRQIITGPILIPDQPIERYTKDLGSFFIVFTKDVIAKLARNLFTKDVYFNYEHEPDRKISGKFQEVWLSGSPDKSNKLGYDLPEGTLFASVKIDDKDFWMSEIKSGNVTGFSIEAIMDLIDIKMTKIQLAQVETIDGMVIHTDSESFEQGVEVYTMQGEEKTPCPDGEYELGNGYKISVSGGKVTEVVEMTEEQKAEQAADVAMKKLIEPHLKPFIDQIEELKVKLSDLEVKMNNAPGKKEEKKEVPVKLSNQELVKRYLEGQKKIKEKK